MHPCAYFSHRLSPAERNYDIGNRELLAVKLTLEEWRHWLEGSGEPFIVWTDHKNLEYIRSAKRLNSRQAQWAFIFLFVTVQVLKTLNLMRCPALVFWFGLVFDQPEPPLSPELILPKKIVVFAVTLEIESKVHTALRGVTPPPGCPPSHLFVPENLRSNVIRWGHCSKVACHPGVSHTIFLVKQRFWWQSMARDIRLFVLACSVCAEVERVQKYCTQVKVPLHY